MNPSKFVTHYGMLNFHLLIAKFIVGIVSDFVNKASHLRTTFTFITNYNLLHASLDLSLEEFFDAPAVSHLRGHQFKVRQP